VTLRPVRGRRVAAAALALSTLVVLAALVYLVLWWTSGTPPLGAP
jgi:hypothetical protein